MIAGAHGSPKKLSDPLELELSGCELLQVGAGN